MTGDLSIFREVATQLEKTNSVGWDASYKSVQTAHQNLGAPETKVFLDECLQPIIAILLEQHPSRIEMHQRQCIENCLHAAIQLLYQLLKDEQDDFFATLLIVFDDRRTFYKGGAVKYWNHMPGAPEVRMRCIQTFAQKRGFDELPRVLQRKGCKWQGAECSRILLQAALEARNCIRDESILTSLAGSVMDPLTQLNEEDLKKESTESMSSLITVIRRAAEAEDPPAFFEFWLKLTLTYIQSKALPLRLFAWDQVVNIIEAARKARPPARRYLVKGAGVDHVNGIYEYIGDRNIAPGYQHDCGNGVVLTLFRCQMRRSRSKWWFISEADKDQPGTDKDVDYYQHRSTIHQEQEPSATGWISCNTQAAKGKDPPPTLERLEPLVELGKENDTLEHQLMRWVLENRIVEDVFGASMHREVVNRSGAVLKFLSMMKGLTHSHLDMIWKACVGQTEAEAVEEIHTVLASLITCLQPALVVHLVETVRASLRDAFAESIALIEKLGALAFADVAAQGTEVLDALSVLLWDVLQHPLIREHKAKTVIREFFKSALQRLPEKRRQYAFLGHCLDAIRASASAITQPDYDESEALNALRMAQFLLEVFPPAQLAETLENLAEHQHLPDLLFSELAAFKGRCVLRARLPPSTPRLDFKPVDHAERIKLRLNMLRYVHSGSETLKLTFQRLTEIWDVLNGPKERELFFVFLLESCNTKANLEPHAFSLEVMGQVFQVIMCQEADWHILDDRAYNAFRQYFATVRKWPDSMYSTVGVNALWRIGLTARTQTVAEAATRDLLAFYGEGDVAGGDGSIVQAGARGVDLRFLRQIFQHLAACRDELRAGVSDSAEVDTTLKAERCLRLLQGAVATGKMHGWSPSHLIPHGVRGQSGRRAWTVEPRRILPQSAVGGANKSQLMKLEPFQLSMHPLETVGVLRRRIATRCEHSVASVKLISVGKHLQKDDVVLDTLNAPEKAEVQAVLMLQPQVPQQQGATPPPAAAVVSADDSAMAVEPPVAPAGPAGEPVQAAPQAASVGEVIANAEEYCNILFDLLETTTGEPPAFAGVIWEVLLAIPTEARALELVRLAAQNVDTETQTSHEGNGRTVTPAGWSALISPTHWHRSVYFMQILDAMLQPSEDVLACEGMLLMPPEEFLRAFVRTGGFAHILEIFMRTGVDQGGAGPGGGDAAAVQGMATACALHIVKFCMFGERGARVAPSPRSESHMPVDGNEGVAGSPGDPVQLLGGSRRVRPLLDRLVQVIHQTHSRAMRGGAAEGEWQVTVDALATLEMLLSCAGADLVPVLISNPAVQQLIVDILLRNPTPRVRDQMRQLVLTEAAPDLGRSVFTLCLGVLEQLEPHCSTCHEFFTAVQALSRLLPATEDPAADGDSQKASLLLRGLARLVAGRLTSFPRPGDNAERQQAVLTGLLTLLLELVKRDVDGRLFKGTEFEHMVDRAFDDLLFAVPSLQDKTYRPICPLRDWKTRQLVFLALLELVRQRHSELSYLVKKIDDFARRGSADLRNRWSYECSYEAKTYPGQYVGLRNQGCTCYMNSLLQNLFMIPQLRNAVLHAWIKQRKLIPGSDVSDDALTGLRISVRWTSGQRAEATVQEYDSLHGTHTIKYDGNGADSEVTLELRKGREGRETGEFDVVPAPTRCTPQIVLERQQTQRVLEQMQRTFCYLQSSEKRYFDPRMLVEACKCLNLQYSVYQQNDASEFCDKLLDKLEASLKGTPQLHDLNTVFGGRQVYQKIPQGCEHRDEKEEPFIRLELIIRGKDSIQESLSSFVEGEMMDGENKVECEGCGTKKPTIRRVCLGQLPNVLVLHLKRFDLDYSTFETVKLNNHCAFPMRLNVKPYTREGLEEAARAAAIAAAMEAVPQGGGADAAAGDVAAPSTGPGQSTTPSAVQAEDATAPEPMMLDDGEYDYELKGVVIHAGVAQGGHYYSYIKDRQKGREDLWYKFDDEDVTVFDPAHIEAQCFGGTTMKTTTWQGVTNTVEQDRVSNALMLFYEKVRPRMPAPAPEAAPVTEPAPMPAPPEVDPLGTSDGGAGEGDRMDVGPDKANAAVEPPLLPLVECHETDDFEFGPDGCSAFDEEVWQANVSFIQHCYLFDHQFQAFLSGLLSLVYNPATPSDDDAPQPPLPPPPTRAPAFTSTLNVDPLLANPCRPRWDPLAPEVAPLRMDVLRMGVLFLLDVILHSRDRPGLSAWAAHLRHAFSVEPEAAPWILSVFSQPGGYWLRSFFLECSDSTARMWALQLLDEAVRVVAGGEDEAVVLTDPSLTVAEAASRSPVAAVLERAVSLLEDVNKHWRHVDELFCLYRDVARHSEAARSFLVRCDLVYKLTMLVVGDRAPPALLKDLPKEWIAEAQTHHHADFLYLLEAVATLVGVPQMQKVPLLEETDDRGFASEYKLTHPVRQALTTIYNENSRNGGMNMQDIMKYLDRCNGSPQVIDEFDSGGYFCLMPDLIAGCMKVPNFQIKNMLSKYDTLPDGRLSVTGFLAYYRDTAVYQMKQVWQDLHAHGFRNDLSRATSASVDYDMVDLSSLPPLRLPQRSELAITLLDFYTTMFDVLQPETCGILTRVCQENLEVSRRMLGQLLGEIGRWVDSWNSSSAARDIEILLTMIQVILSSADAYKDDRAYFVHWSEHGLCMCIIRKAQRWSDTNEGIVKQQMDYYATSLLRNVLNKHPESRQQAEKRGEWWRWICQQYGPGYGGWGDRSGHGSGFSYSSKRRGSYGDSDDDESSNHEGAVKVSGAGNASINGLFKFCRVSRNSNIYERTTTVGGAATTYSLYRCELEDRHHRWYISVVPKGREPGTREDYDFYFCAADPTVPYPPQKGWRCVDDQWVPAPTLQPADDDSDDEADAGSGPPTPSNVSPTGSEGDSMDPSPPREDGEDGYGSMEGGAVDAEGEDL